MQQGELLRSWDHSPAGEATASSNYAPLAVDLLEKPFAQAGRAIRGRLSDPSGLPIAAADIMLLRTELSGRRRPHQSEPLQDRLVAEVRTNASGEFTAAVDPFVPHHLVAVNDWSFRTVLACHAGDYVDIRLPAACQLTGTVRGDDGAPIAGAIVAGWEKVPIRATPSLVNPVFVREVLTDVAGTYTLSLPQVPVAVCARLPRPRSSQVQEATLELTSATHELDFDFGPGTRVYGEVVDSSGLGLSGATIRSAEDPRAASSTNDEGYFELFLVHELTDTLVVSAPGFASRHVTVERDSDPRSVELSIQLAPSRVVIGQLRGPRAEGVSAASVTLIDVGDEGAPWLTTSSFEDGHFKFTSIAEDTTDFALVVEKRGFARKYVPNAHLFEQADRRVDVGIVSLDRESVISGQVVLENGEPVDDALVILGRHLERRPTYQEQALRRQLRTDSFGRFVFSGVSEGTYLVSARKAGFPPVAHQIVVIPREGFHSDLLLTMELGALITGVVVTPSMEPVPRAKVRLITGGPNSPIVTANDYGEFAFHEVPDTRGYEINAWPPTSENRFGSGRITGVRAGDTYLQVILPESVEIQGTIVDSNGSPVRRAFVYIYDLGDEKKHLLALETTDSGGGFVARVPATANLEIRAYPSIDAPERSRGFRVDRSDGASVRYLNLPFDDEIRIVLH